MANFKFISLWLSAICIIIFVVQSFFPAFTDLFILSKIQYYQVWRLLTSIFLHASLIHLAYNVFALAVFGSILEGIIGYKKLLSLFLISGIFANIISVFFYNSSLGASGAIFGLVGALAVLSPKLSVWVYNIPMPMFLAASVWIAGDLFGAATFLAGSSFDNTGNIAHLAGVVFGISYGFLVRNRYVKKEQPKQRVYLNEEGMRRWEDVFMK